MIGLLAGIRANVATLVSRLTSGRATNLDNLDAAVTTRAAASTALSTATWTGTKAGYLDAAITSRASATDWTPTKAGYVDVSIKSRQGKISRIQRGVTNVVLDQYGKGYLAQTIYQVSTDYADVSLLGAAQSDSTAAGAVSALLYLAASTSLECYANAPAGVGTAVVGWQIIEYPTHLE